MLPESHIPREYAKTPVYDCGMGPLGWFDSATLVLRPPSVPRMLARQGPV